MTAAVYHRSTTLTNEPLCVKTNNFGFRQGTTETSLYSHKQVRSLRFWITEEGGCTICAVKTKVQISFAVTAKLVCTFVFAYMQIVGFLMQRLK